MSVQREAKAQTNEQTEAETEKGEQTEANSSTCTSIRTQREQATEILAPKNTSRGQKYSQLTRIPDASVSNATHADTPAEANKTARRFPSFLIENWIHGIHFLIKHEHELPQKLQGLGAPARQYTGAHYSLKHAGKRSC